MIVKFNRVFAAVDVHVCAKFHQAKFMSLFMSYRVNREKKQTKTT